MSADVDLGGALRERAASVDAALADELSGGSPGYLHEAARHLVEAGGKRLRPVLLLLVAEAVGPDGDDRDRLPAAVAVELIHTLSLIHDDIVDEDDLRRGVPSVHVAWDGPTGIVAGDLLYARAFDLVSEANAPAEARLACIRVLAGACRALCEGQARDMALPGRGEVREEEYLRTVEAKTGALFAAAAEIGAVLGGDDRAVAAAASSFGRSLGTAFQLHDDVLDVTGSTDVLGKPAGSDLTAGKPTLVTIHAGRQGVEVSPRRASDGGIEGVRADLEAAGSIDYVQRTAGGYVERASADLEALPASRARDTLADLATFAVERER